MDAQKKLFVEADTAAGLLSKKLGNPEWLLGVGVGAGLSSGFYISVRVTLDAPENLVPASFNDFPVEIRRQNMAKAQ